MGKKKKQEKQDKSEKQKKRKLKEENAARETEKAKKEKRKEKKKKESSSAGSSIIMEEKVTAAVEKSSAIEEKKEKVSSSEPKKNEKVSPRKSVAEKNSVRGTADLDRGMAEVFRAFGDESRLQILDLLKDRELCAGELLEFVSIVQSTLSHHMKILTETGIVRCRKQGKKTYYTIDKAVLEKASAFIMKWS